MDKCSCGNPKESWQDICKSCYAKKMNIKRPTKESDIRRQVFLKVASNQLEKATATELISYAKTLETAYNQW
jgi:hypothetical protein